MTLNKILIETNSDIPEFYADKFTIFSRSFYQTNNIYMFIAHQEASTWLLGSISEKDINDEDISTFLALFDCTPQRFTVMNSDFLELNDLMRLCTINRFGRPYDDVAAIFNIYPNALVKCFTPIQITPGTKKVINETLKQTTYITSLTEELKRINDKRNPKNFIAHPAHYIVTGSDESMIDKALSVLLPSLYARNRILCQTGVKINVSKDTYDMEAIESAFNISKYGVVIIQIDDECNNNNTSYAFNDRAVDSLNLIGPFINKHKSDVLTVFVLPDLAKNLKNRIYDYCDIPFIEIEEEMVKNNQAKLVLQTMADSYSINLQDNLDKYIKKGQLYNAKDLKQLAQNWFDDKIYNQLYPAYDTKITKTTKDVKPVGSAYDELMDMVGLVKVKDLINKAINYRNVCKVMEDRQLVTNPNSFHMVFTGNPGTAKTTVARLFAQILKENGVLSEGKLVECGRADLVGKYVGWTADLVKEKFKEAKGSVLFIDEAYSLLDGDHNTFGIEAINCIVQEMENHREDTIVIFAGYPDEMKDFLEKNPGMNSRIAFHIDFDNYNEEELFAITELMAKKMALKLDKNVKDFLIPTYKEAMESKTFGNGRYVRNLLEQAMLNHCDRISKEDLTTISNDDLVTINVEDFNIEPVDKPKKGIGFI